MWTNGVRLMTSLGQIWSNYITQNDDGKEVKPVTANESVVNQNNDNDNDNEEALKYQNYKKGILQGIINGGKLNNEPTASQ